MKRNFFPTLLRARYVQILTPPLEVQGAICRIQGTWGEESHRGCWGGRAGTAAGEDQLQEGGQARCGHQRLDRKCERHDE